MYIIIIGGGKVGYYLTKHLINSEHEVLLIEKEKKKCDVICDELGEVSYQGDGCEVNVMKKTGFSRADVICAVTGDDEDNLIICQMAKRKFSVPRCIARVNNPKNEEIFKKLGVDWTVSATVIIQNLIEEEVSPTDFLPIISLRKGKVEVIEMKLTKNSKVIGKKIKEVNFGEDFIFASIVRGEKVIFPRGNTEFKEGDILVILSTPEKKDFLKENILGSKD
jgi:trk system potassium uptake protein TrkA